MGLNFWRAYRPPAADIAVATCFVVVGQVMTWGQFDEPEAFAGTRSTNALLNLLLMGAIAWRRRAPLAALCWAMTVYYLPQAVVQHDVTLLAGFIPLIVLTASAGYWCSRRRALLAAVIALVGLATVTLATPWLRSLDAFGYNVLLLLAPWLAARGLREREDRAGALGSALASERATREAAIGEVARAERVRIARELHDIVAHSVAVMVIQMGAARMQLTTGVTGAEDSLLAAEEAGRQTLDDLSRLLGVLRADDEVGNGSSDRSSYLPQPGLSQIGALVAQTRAVGVLVEVEVEGDPVDLPAGIDLTAYRIVQEALTNIIKHSRLAHVTVRLAYQPESLILEVTDDGPHTPANAANGHGLIGINERVSLFGGTVRIGPVPDSGWSVHAELPLPLLSRYDQRAALLPTS